MSARDASHAPGNRVHRLCTGFKLFLALILLCGCTRKPLEPGPSVGTWTSLPERQPWFGYVEYVGFCGGPSCSAAVVLFEQGQVLWLSWGPGRPAAQLQLRASDEPRREAIEDALELVSEGPRAQRVLEVRTARLGHNDAARIRDRILKNAKRATDPGPINYDCTDVGMPTVALRTARHWRVDIAPRDDFCGENEDPQEAWFEMEEQGAALMAWIGRADWGTFPYAAEFTPGR